MLEKRKKCIYSTNRKIIYKEKEAVPLVKNKMLTGKSLFVFYIEVV